MPIVMDRKGDEPKSSLNSIAKNVLRTEFRDEKGRNTFIPKDDRFYDALASIVMWHSIMDANPNQVRFYVSKGYNTNIRIQNKAGEVYTLMGFALSVAKLKDTKEFRSGIKRILNYLEARIPESSGVPPVFRVVEKERSKNFNVQTHYQIGQYNCVILLQGKHLTIGEFFGKGDSRVLGK